MQSPSMIDTMQGQLPPVLKWCLAGMGGVAGFVYAQQHGIPLQTSCIVAGAAVGFCLVASLFVGLRLLKMLAVIAVLLIVLNYAVLIPYGYGNHLPGWIDTGKAAMRWLNPAPLIRQWSTNIEPRER